MLTGIIRQVEKNGIIVIPKVFRQVLNIKENDQIIFEIDKEKNIFDYNLKKKTKIKENL